MGRRLSKQVSNAQGFNAGSFTSERDLSSIRPL
jgi:hypothetical protein